MTAKDGSEVTVKVQDGRVALTVDGEPNPLLTRYSGTALLTPDEARRVAKLLIRGAVVAEQ